MRHGRLRRRNMCQHSFFTPRQFVLFIVCANSLQNVGCVLFGGVKKFGGAPADRTLDFNAARFNETLVTETVAAFGQHSVRGGTYGAIVNAQRARLL